MKNVKWIFLILLLATTAWGAKYFTDLIVQGNLEVTGTTDVVDLNLSQDLDVAGNATIDLESILTGSVAIGTAASPNANLVLDVVSTTKAMAAPRMTAAQRDLIATPVAGSLIFVTDDAEYNFYDGSDWLPIGGGGGGGISNAEYNFLVASDGNSRFERNVDGWTGSTTAPVHETTTEIEGEASLSWTPVGAETLRSTAVPVPAWAYGTNCYAEIYYTLGDTEYSLKVLDGSNVEIVSSGGVTTSTNAFLALSGETAVAYRTFVCPSSGSIKISLETSGAADEIVIDRAYVGQNFRLSEVNQAVLAGESYFAATTNCAWVVTSTSASAFPTDTDCPGPTIVRSQLGSWQTTDSNLPIQTINNLPAGTYKATFIFLSVSSTSTGARYHINDGTTTSIGSPGYNDTNSAASTVTATFEYSSAGNRAFQLYGSSVSGSVTAFASVAPINFILEKFPSEGELAYTPPPTIELTNNFSAFVTDGAATTTVSNENQNFIEGNCTNASAGRYVCTFVSGVFNSVTPNCVAIAAHTDNNDTSVVFDSISSSSIALSTIRAGAYSDRNFMISCQRGDGDYSVKQSSAPLLVNSVVTDYSGVVEQNVASIDCDGASSVNSQLGSWVSSVGNISAGQCSITLSAGAFSSTPYCFATELLSGSAPRALSMTNTSATALTIDCVGDTGSDCSDFDANIFCIGPK